MTTPGQVEDVLRRMHATRDRFVQDSSRFQERYGSSPRGTKGSARASRAGRASADRRRASPQA